MVHWKAQLPGISKDEGANDFKNIVFQGGQALGGPVYIIKPDKFFFESNDLMTDLELLGLKKTSIVFPKKVHCDLYITNLILQTLLNI